MQDKNEVIKVVIDRRGELVAILPEFKALAVAVFEQLRQLVDETLIINQNEESRLLIFLNDLNLLLDAYKVLYPNPAIYEETRERVVLLTQKIHDILSKPVND
ncbi:MAG TPA: hypothetical protein VF209_03675 [Patescibacteria group bacterium]